MSVSGKFSTMSIADLIQWGRTAQRTGLLRVSNRRGKDIQMVFRDGRIIFSGTNDKRERWGSYIKHLGFCTQDDLEEAFKIKESTGASVASIMVRQGYITEDVAVSTLSQKTMEDVCDVFLWPDGDFVFDPIVPPVTSSLTLNVDPIYVVCEGVRRAEIWSRISAIIHPASTYERVEEPGFDSTATWEDGTMAKIILSRLDGSSSVSAVLESLPFSRYKVFRAMSELLERGLIRPADVTMFGDREKRVVKKIEDVDRATNEGRWTEAIEMLQGLVTANPGRADLVAKLIEVTRGFERSVYRHNFTKDDVPVVTVGVDALSRVNLYPVEAFLLSRIDGKLTVRDILRISPVAEVEGLRALKRLLSARVIDFPSRTGEDDSRKSLARA